VGRGVRVGEGVAGATAESRARVDAFLALVADERAFRAWYDEALSVVYAFVLYRTGGRSAIAMELTQETFVEAVRSAGRFDGRSAPVTWVCGIARHRIADHFRRLVRDKRRTVPLSTVPAEAEKDPRDWARSADTREDVLRALRRLPAPQASVLALHYLDGLSVPEIARSLGRSQKAIESLVNRARESFRRAYAGPEGATDG
jgi:RNA polymerase sigma-70 factor (ECF subfamily)